MYGSSHVDYSTEIGTSFRNSRRATEAFHSLPFTPLRRSFSCSFCSLFSPIAITEAWVKNVCRTDRSRLARPACEIARRAGKRSASTPPRPAVLLAFAIPFRASRSRSASGRVRCRRRHRGLVLRRKARLQLLRARRRILRRGQPHRRSTTSNTKWNLRILQLCLKGKGGSAAPTAKNRLLSRQYILEFRNRDAFKFFVSVKIQLIVPSTSANRTRHAYAAHYRPRSPTDLAAQPPPPPPHWHPPSPSPSQPSPANQTLRGEAAQEYLLGIQ
jgi:hypothetical protein